MKKILFIIILFLSFNLYSQQDKTLIINENVSGSLSSILANWSDKFNIKIAFNHSLLSEYFIEKSIANLTIKEAIIYLLDNTDLTLLELNENLIIKQDTSSLNPNNKVRTLSGKIIDKNSGETLPYANIIVEDFTLGTTSNKDGFFSLLTIPPKAENLLVSYLGYKTDTLTLQSLTDDQNSLVISLSPKSQYLSDLVIKDYRFQQLIRNNIALKTSIDQIVITKLPSLGEPDIFKSIQMLPGVSASNETSSGLNIRGSLPSQNLVLLDDFTVYHLDHFFGVFSAINPEIVKSINVYKGGYGPEYGGRVGGVVDIIGKTGNSNHLSGKVSVNFINANAYIETPIGKKMTLLLAGRRSYTDIIRSPLYKSLLSTARENNFENFGGQNRDVFREEDPNFYYYDINAKLNFRPTEKDALSLSFYQSNDNLTNDFFESFDDNLIRISLTEKNKWGNDGLNARWSRQWNPKYESMLMFSFSNYFNNYNFNEDFRDEIEDISFAYRFLQINTIQDISIKFNNSLKFSDRLNFDFGLTNDLYQLKFDQQFDDFVLEENIINESGNVHAINSKIDYVIEEKLNMSLGNRLSFTDWDNTFYFEPRISLNYQLSSRILLKGAYSRHAQFIKQVIFSDPLAGDLNYWLLAQNELEVTKANHLIFGANYENNGFKIDLEFYSKRLNGISQFIQTDDFFQLAPQVNGLIGNGEESIFGAELLIQKQIKKYRGWIAYTLSSAKQRFEEINENKYFPSLQDQRHELKSVHIYESKKIDLSLISVFATGKPYVFYDIISRDIETGDIRFQRDFSNAKRVSNYFRIDVSANYKWRISESDRAKFGIAFINLTNHQNIRSRRLDPATIFIETISETNYYKDLPLLDFTPTLFLHFEF